MTTTSKWHMYTHICHARTQTHACSHACVHSLTHARTHTHACYMNILCRYFGLFHPVFSITSGFVLYAVIVDQCALVVIILNKTLQTYVFIPA